ncbi:SGNH/GDSL hydrolase family protein [Persicitalea jodogahamensis]|uniref:Lysophospholipase n=1 Tax=Persicitalea jodogahamensis TaxID=402147 RepID=A0A8J3GB45_9BACT|nr:GDSL-type esterase/lipase family protein [Persicitalea jodogahamensis]GHB79516.1 lysophospholipase [Persicitalea jodogahamensis]
MLSFKSLNPLFLILALLLPLLAMRADKPLRVVFFGDSITQAGVGETGYITQLRGMLKEKGLGDQYELMGAGIGGNKVYDLYLRMDEDVLAKKPDVVFIYVGINDVWHKATHGTGTDYDKFVKFYEAIIKKLQDNNIRTILCTPSVIGERADYSNQQDGDLNRYANAIRDLAKEHDLGLVDLRKDFQNYLVKNNKDNVEKGILTRDRVHLTEAGDKFVAEEMMAGLLKK